MNGPAVDLPTRASHVVLALDAAPGVGSVALLAAGGGAAAVLTARTVPMRPPTRDARRPAQAADDDPLMRAIADTLREAGIRAAELGGVACGAGPGGFTSLRIAVALAKGIAHACGCPLLAAPSLAWAAAVRAPAAGTWIVTLDALRGEQYVAVVRLREPAAVALGGAAGVAAAATIEARAVEAYAYLGVHCGDALPTVVGIHRAHGVLAIDADLAAAPIAAGAAAFAPTPVDLALFEPTYGRLAEAQVKWEAIHGPLPSTRAIA